MSILLLPAHEEGDLIGTIVKWHKKPGDWVRPGDRLFSYTTNSGSYVSISELEGRLFRIYLQEGQSAPLPADAALLDTYEVEDVDAFEYEADAPFEDGEEQIQMDDDALPRDIEEEEEPEAFDEAEEEEDALDPPAQLPGMYMDVFSGAALQKCLEALRLAGRLRGRGVTDIKAEVLLVYAALVADAPFLGLQEYEGFKAAELSEEYGEYPELFAGFYASDALFGIPPRAQMQEGLYIGRPGDTTYICLVSAAKAAEAERFLSDVKAVLEGLDKHIE